MNISKNFSFLNKTLDTSDSTSGQPTFSLNFQNVLGLVILLENVLTLVILYRSEKLAFQVRTLAIALTASDCLFGLGVAVPKKALGSLMR